MSTDFSLPTEDAVPSNLPIARISVTAAEWLSTTAWLHAENARLLSLWGTDDRDRDGCFRIYGVWLLPKRVILLEHRILDTAQACYPGVADLFPAAAKMQRAVHDLLGVAPDTGDPRGWLRHDGWPETVFPLRRDFNGASEFAVAPKPYPFVQVQGDGVHEIAVGPVHAGIIEPGHFRFSVVGEKVLRLEERLGYTHKGVAKRFQNLPQLDGHRLAARVSGDSAVAYSWAWCAALEPLCETVCPPRAASLRALALEHERLANHLGDLGALGNDAGFAFGLTQFSGLKEALLRVNAEIFGARYLMDYVVPGGVVREVPGHAVSRLCSFYDQLEPSVAQMRSIYDEHAGMQDRFRQTGRLEQPVAERLGALGMVARASGISCDLRRDLPWTPYDRLPVRVATQANGDVAARVQVRFDEIAGSLELCRHLVGDLPAGPVQNPMTAASPNLLGVGIIEGWRGPVMIALETGSDGAIRWAHAHDPSWQNWPLLERAILGNIVPDFPLINKSFNLSYSGQDG